MRIDTDARNRTYTCTPMNVVSTQQVDVEERVPYNRQCFLRITEVDDQIRVHHVNKDCYLQTFERAGHAESRGITVTFVENCVLTIPESP